MSYLLGSDIGISINLWVPFRVIFETVRRAPLPTFQGSSPPPGNKLDYSPPTPAYPRWTNIYTNKLTILYQEPSFWYSLPSSIKFV